MKIGEARAAYGVCLRSYYDKQRELGKQKKALEEKINNTENGAVIYKNEAAIIELQYEAVNDKKSEYQDYVDELIEQHCAIANKYVAEQQADAYAEAAKDMQKIMIVARRIMKGDKVPAKDEKKLMEFDYKLYSLAKSAGAMAKVRKRKEHKSLWEDEDKKEYPDATEAADNTEVMSEGPEIINVEDTMSAATADMDIGE